MLCGVRGSWRGWERLKAPFGVLLQQMHMRMFWLKNTRLAIALLCITDRAMGSFVEDRLAGLQTPVDCGVRQRRSALPCMVQSSSSGHVVL